MLNNYLSALIYLYIMSKIWPSLSSSLNIIIVFMKDGMNDGRLKLPYLGEKINS